MADTTSIFYKIGQKVKSNVGDAITAHKEANNTFTGTNDFQKAVTVGTGGANANLTVNGNSTITGDLTVQGTTTTLSTTNLDVKDNFITLSDGASAGAYTKDQGFYFERASGSQAGAFIFDESDDKFRLGTVAPTASQTIGSENVEFKGKSTSVKVTIAVSGTDNSVSGARVDNAGTDEITFTVGSAATVADLIANEDVADYLVVSTDGDGTATLSAISEFSLVLSDGTSANADVLGGSLDLGAVILDGVNLGNLDDFNAGYNA